jgi:hypothetical protein
MNATRLGQPQLCKARLASPPRRQRHRSESGASALSPDTAVAEYDYVAEAIRANRVSMGYLFPGQLGGVLAGPSGAVLSNAHVTVTQPDTGFRNRLSPTGKANGSFRVFPRGESELRRKRQDSRLPSATLNTTLVGHRPTASH